MMFLAFFQKSNESVLIPFFFISNLIVSFFQFKFIVLQCLHADTSS